MKKKWFVIGPDGNITVNPKDDLPETFRTLAAAQRRAQGYAESQPGDVVTIAEGVMTVACPVGAAQTQRVK